MTQLFEVRPEKRLRLVDAKKHAWFEKDKGAIDALYEHVVTRGEVLNPSSARQILRDFALDGYAFGAGQTLRELAHTAAAAKPLAKRGGLFLSYKSMLSEVAEDNVEAAGGSSVKT